VFDYSDDDDVRARSGALKMIAECLREMVPGLIPVGFDQHLKCQRSESR
jgi:hypothetical protein